MNYLDVLAIATKELKKLHGKTLDVLEISKPHTIEYAIHLAKVVSKTSPLIGNMIEFAIVEQLNKADWNNLGKWVRQDPGFPDALFQGDMQPNPGIEIKTWFPLATEITARFKDSISHFDEQQTNVAVVAWLPEHLIYGKPKIIDVWVGSAQSVASARDTHYHNPPDYLVFEPEDTSLRAANLQQTNTNGYKFQGSKELLKKAEAEVKSWGKDATIFSANIEYQDKLKTLLGKYPYRLDTNFAKMDRIGHEGLEDFKKRVLNSKVENKTIAEWAKSDWSTLVQDEDPGATKIAEELV